MAARMLQVVSERPVVLVTKSLLDQPFILGATFIQALQLVAAGAEGAHRRRPQACDIGIEFQASIHQFLGQRADNAVAAGKNLADPLGMTTRFLNQSTRRRIDDGGHAPRLRIEGIPDRHCLLQRLEDTRGDAIDTADTGHLPDPRRAGIAGG